MAQRPMMLFAFRANLTWTHRCLSGRQPPSSSSPSQRSRITPTTKWSQTLRKPSTSPDRWVSTHSWNRHTLSYHHPTLPTYPELSKLDFVFVDQQHSFKCLTKLLKLIEIIIFFLQLFWEKKLSGLNAYDIAEELVKTMELPKGLQGD